MLIAVIDNEFNVWHDVFSIPPEGGRYNEEGIRQLGEFVGFGIAPQYTMEDIFYNGKIVYAYDYGENDNVCRDKERIHGTHVAGIAAGNNGGRGQYDFKGTAYDAQLAFFKISDTNGRLLDEAIVAALDDAVKLSPDVINCSYGAIEYLTHDYEGKQLYEKLMQSGIAVIAAAGNDEYNGYAQKSRFTLKFGMDQNDALYRSRHFVAHVFAPLAGYPLSLTNNGDSLVTEYMDAGEIDFYVSMNKTYGAVLAENADKPDTVVYPAKGVKPANKEEGKYYLLGSKIHHYYNDYSDSAWFKLFTLGGNSASYFQGLKTGGSTREIPNSRNWAEFHSSQ